MGYPTTETLLRRIGEAMQDMHIARERNDHAAMKVAVDRYRKARQTLAPFSVCVIAKIHQLRKTTAGLSHLRTDIAHGDFGELGGTEAVLDIPLIYECLPNSANEWRWQKGKVEVSFSCKAEVSPSLPNGEVMLSQGDSDKVWRYIFGETPPRVNELS